MKHFFKILRLTTLLLVAVITCTARAEVLTNDTVIAPDNTVYDGQDLVVSNCVLTVDGAHVFSNLRVAAGATLTHSAAAGGSLTASVTNELQQLTGTNPAPLGQLNIILSSVIVTDTNQLVTYTNDVDYELTSVGLSLTLQRITNSTIPDGGFVFVSYDYQTTVGAGLNLTVSNDFELEPGASVNANGRGFGGSAGAGMGGSAGSPLSGAGGGHGGFGGVSSSNATNGPAYGSPFACTNLGSGGGMGAGGVGGAGGGLVQLSVGGLCILNGTVTANGQNAMNNRAGGGSGGSIWITAQTISGGGSITAAGGAGEPVHGGGGGGGRIALDFQTNLFAGSVSAFGGAGWQRGGAGSILIRSNGTSGAVTFDNGGIAGAVTPLSFDTVAGLIVQGRAIVAAPQSQTLASLLVRSNSTITSSATNNATLALTVQSDAVVEPGALISLDGKGYSPDAGPGVGASSGVVGSGAGHGGYGGNGQFGATVAAGGNYYGSLMNPTTSGSGGRSITGYPGGAGGGAVRMFVSGTLQLDGEISADGTAGVGTLGGGAAGGSVWLSVGGFSGAGVVSVNGGSGGLPYGGGGAGGRVAVFAASNIFTGKLTAYGGAGAVAGGAGTIFTKLNIETYPSLRVDNNGLSGTNTILDTFQLNNLTIGGGAILRSTGGLLTLNNLTVGPNSSFNFGGTINVASTANIAVGGSLLGDGLGYSSGSGPGSGGGFNTGATGAGHGGYGGRGAAGPFGGNAYDSTASPSTPGSGGGSNPSGTGGAGGGALRLIVSGPLILDGKISANGLSTVTNNSGGGSGGSIWLTLNQFSGSGAVSADGGSGHLPNGGGGGGGRIAISYNTNSFTGSISAKGGGGFVGGGAGTIYLKANSSSTPNLIVDNGGMSGTNTVLDLSSLANLTISSGGNVTSSVPIVTLGNLNIASNATLRGGISLTLNISGSANIAAGGSISADGLGSASGLGIGPGQYSGSGSGGGGHAGYGGRGAVVAGGNAYGSLNSPLLPGSGGGGGTSVGGNGGGVVRITAIGPLTLDGKISANGSNSSTNNGGGGSGGSVWLSLDELIGSGTITADGGNGYSLVGGGGGGGRIAVSYSYIRNNPPTNRFTGTYSARGGNGFIKGGAGTIYIRTNNANTAVVVVDNGGVRGTNSLVSGTGSFDLTVLGGAVATNIGSPRDLFVRSNAWLVQSGNTTISRNATFDAGGGFNLDGLGNSLTGAGSTSADPKGGGGHGGYGALNPAGAGATYDSASFPTQGGSPGGNGSGTSVAPLGGSGGGATQLTVGDTLLVNGEISADGLNGDLNSGGGSGGGLRLQVATLAGNGAITAIGGAGNGTAGGGGGGRIAIHYYTSNLFTGTIAACGGSGAVAGGAGTIYLQKSGYPASTLLLDNCGLVGTNTPLSQSVGLATSVTVTDGAVAEFQGNTPVFSNLVVNSGGLVTTHSQDTNLFLGLLGDLTVNSGAGIILDAKGFGRAMGTGAGATVNSKGAGGGYGGAGGDSASGATGGVTYGSASRPVDRGSGGADGSGSPASGSEGGGAIRLAVAGTLTVDGLISAGGGLGVQDDSGGGAGGSVWVTVGKFTGGGALAANGGDGDLYGGGGGGGGRIAIYSPMNTFTGLVSVAGGDGAFPGGTGTVFTASSLTGFDVISQTPLGVVSNAVGQITLEFSEPINPLSVAPDDFALYTPYGTVESANFTLSLLAPATLRVSFPTQNVPGDYRLEVGPAIESLLAMPMSQVYTGAFTSVLPLLSGTVTDTNGQPVAGVLLQPDGGLISTTTDANGNYSLGFPVGWNGTVTPALGNFLFAPGSRNYAGVSTDVTNQNYLMISSFVPALETGTKETNLFINWQGLSGITYQLYWSTNLTTTNWYLFDNPIPGTNGPMQLLLPIGVEPEIFFRLGARN